jgi:hypothetical protein
MRRRSDTRPHAPSPSLATVADGLDALFPTASRIVEAVMEHGARTRQGEDWRALPTDFHLARARRHLDLLAAGDVSEPHLAHAACRLLMELECANSNNDIEGMVR